MSGQEPGAKLGQRSDYEEPEADGVLSRIEKGDEQGDQVK